MIKTILDQNRKKLLEKLEPIYKQQMGQNEKIPAQLTKISKDLLAIYPKNIFFKVIEIKTFKEKPDKELNDCFPDEDDTFKAQIYEFLFRSMDFFNNNSIIINGIKNIIDNMNQDSLLKKYTSLIDIITNNFDAENKLLCEVLVTNPFKYKELLFLVDSNLKISPLPKDAQDFYAMKNYSENKKKFVDYTTKNAKNDGNENLRKELMDKIKLMKTECDNNNKLIKSECDNEIKLMKSEINLLKEEIIILKNESKITKEALFKIQIRDVINAFINTLLWSLQIKNSK